MPARADYEGSMASVYDRGRRLAPEAIDTWRRAVCRHVSRPVERVVDLGAGTGRFSGLLARWLGASIVAALEPAAAMRRSAERHRPIVGVAMVGAAAEALPLRDRSVGVAWLSNVIHHVDDVDTVAGGPNGPWRTPVGSWSAGTSRTAASRSSGLAGSQAPKRSRIASRASTRWPRRSRAAASG